jgi:hypothetical protein
LSLVGYVRLSEGYAQFLEGVRLESQLASLRNLRDRAAAEGGADRDELNRIRTMLVEQIETLKALLSEAENQAVLDENLGLLGSAEKRLAELCFEHFSDEAGRTDSREALERARDWYHGAFEKNPSAHWSGVQYLALQAALVGEIDVKDWKTTYRAAEVDRTRPTEYWAQGSLAELALLAPLVDQGTDESAETYLREMKVRVTSLPAPPSQNPFESTEIQLRRYVDWWRQTAGFFPGTVDLAPEAGRLADLTRRLDGHGQ